MIAIACLGRSGFNFIRGRVFAIIKGLGPPREVSRTRYRVGLVLFTLPLLLGWIGPYAEELIPAYAQHRIAVAGAGDLVLVASLLVLGGEFWEKVRALFVYDARARMMRPRPE